MNISTLQADAHAKLEANLNDGQPLDEGAVFIAGSELLKELPEIILSTVLAVREEVVPKKAAAMDDYWRGFNKGVEWVSRRFDSLLGGDAKRV